MKTWIEIEDSVKSNGNIKTFLMAELYDAIETTSNVRSKITKTLANMNLGHIPRKLPMHRNELVRIYKQNTPVGNIIEQVLSPGEQNDTAIKELLSEEQVNQLAIVEKIRELVS